MLFVAGGVVIAAVALLLLLLLLLVVVVVVVVVVMLNYQPIKELQLSAAQEKECNLLRSFFFFIFVGFTVLILLFLYRESVVSIYQLNELSHI